MKRILIATVLIILMSSVVAALPSSYDCRDLGYVTDAKNQGSCECCGAFTTVAMLESTILLKKESTYPHISTQNVSIGVLCATIGTVT